MIRNRILLKTFAVFFTVEMVISTLAPSVSWALTAGPTAPEATSFEPVDTTDIVNLATGDLAYNIPLLEVPGPSGGYPLSLSYHAGIQPNEEASWVGLGWTLNPGAIVRNVNGFADDQKDQPNSSRYFWKGGNTETYSIGVSVGIAQTPASVSGGLSFSQDTYQGSGVGMYLGVGARIGGEGSPLGIGLTVGVSPYGDPYASTGVSVSVAAGEKNAAALGMGVGASTNFKSVDYSGSVGLSVGYGKGQGSQSLLGASISTGNRGASVNVNVAGASVTNNTESSRVRSTSSGFSIPIPVWYGVTVDHGYSYQRYWMNELDNATVNGALYYPENSSELTTHYFDDKAYDTYSLLDPNLEGGIVDNSVSDKVLGGSFPGFDNYLVHAQGISGYMRPYYFQKHLYKRNNYRKDSDGDKVYETIQYDISKSNPGENKFRAEFRFINDFSNKFEFDPGQIQQATSDENTLPLQYNFSNGSGIETGDGTELNPYTSNMIQGSSYINWFTNQEINARSSRVTTSSFIETVSTGFDRATVNDITDDDNIGGFIIVNASGVKYHFALPAYSYDEYMYSGNKTGTETFNEFFKGGKYAYTWYLTGITGPDYVDRGPDGVADGKLNEFDWGYWVEFEYGKWTNSYAWRNPSEGMTSDLDQNFQNFSTGFKEVYYLDAIRTKTHTALFVKDIRYDAKSCLPLLRNITNVYGLAAYGQEDYVNKNQKINNDARVGGFIPKQETCECFKRKTVPSGAQVHGAPQYNSYIDHGVATYISKPVSSLKLTSVILIDNKDLKSENLSKLSGEYYKQQSILNWNVISDQDNSAFLDQCDFTNSIIDYHLYKNVLDKYDVNLSLREKALRIVEFNTNESESSLSPETSNSFDFNLVKNSILDNGQYKKYAKLTLHALKFLGKAGAELVPPLKFCYDLDNPASGVCDLFAYEDSYSFSLANSKLVAGDIIRFVTASGICYALVESVSGDTHRLKILGINVPTLGSISWQQTKNPPYNKDAYDIWGLYKSDYEKGDDEYSSRLVSNISAKSTDVWSLSQIKSSTGSTITIEYEADTYRQPVLYNSNILRIDNISPIEGTDRFKVQLYDAVPNLDQVIAKESFLDCLMLFASPYHHTREKSCGGGGINSKTHSPYLLKAKLKIKSIYQESDRWILEAQTDTNLAIQFAPPPPLQIQYHLFQWTYNCGDGLPPQYTPCNDPQIPPVLCTDIEQKSFRQTQFIAGNLSTSDEFINVGGSIRVKSIQVRNFSRGNKTSYGYSRPDGGSYGVTSFEPNGLEQVVFKFPVDGELKDYFRDISNVAGKKIYNKELYRKFEVMLANAREIPPPGVLYEYVKVSESVVNEGLEQPLGQYAVYQFEIFKNDNVAIEYSSDQAVDPNNLHDFPQKKYENYIKYSKKESRNVVLKDYTSRVGNLKNVVLYDKNGNMISRTTNEYLHDNLQEEWQYDYVVQARFGGQGVIEESFSDARFVSRRDTDYKLQGVITKREQYPVIQIGQTTMNYKTGITTETKNLAFDFYSGQLTKSVSNDGYGNTYLTEVTPAYRKYLSMSRGSRGGLNMLIQQAASRTEKVIYDLNQEYLPVGLVAASAQTWSENVPVLEPGEGSLQASAHPGIWRMKSSYSFVGDNSAPMSDDGLYPILNNNVPEFTAWHGGLVAPTWQKNSEITLYDVNSHALEAMDVNDNYAATKMTFDQTRVLISGANCRYDELAYSGAEEIPYVDPHDHAPTTYGGGVLKNDGVEVFKQSDSDLITTHTGAKALKLTASGQRAFQYTFTMLSGEDYHASVWVNSNVGRLMYSVNGVVKPAAVAAENRKAGAWYLVTLDIPKSSQPASLKIWCTTTGANCNFDDFRVHPLRATVTSYVYNQWGELSHILDNNNLYTEYRYDNMGRLKETHKETLSHGTKKISEVEYNYGSKH